MTDLIIGFIGGLSIGIVTTFLVYVKAKEHTIELFEGMEKLGIITVNEEVLAEKLAECGSMKELIKRVVEEVCEDE